MHRRFTNGVHMLEIHLSNGLAPDNVAAISVGDREGITTLSIPAPKVSFEIHAPNLIGGTNNSQG